MAMKKCSEDELIKNFWHNINKSIKFMRRPERLFNIVANKTAMLVIDMQNCFCSPKGSIENPDTRAITPNINSIAKQCRKKQIPVIWIRMIGEPDGSDTGLWRLFQPNSPISKDRQNPQLALSNKSKESELWKALDVDKRDYFVNKKRYSALIANSSKLNQLLKKLKKDTLIITGVGTNVCCESTARDAMMLGYKVIFVSDANATFNKFFHETSLMNIKLLFGDVISTRELLEDLS